MAEGGGWRVKRVRPEEGVRYPQHAQQALGTANAAHDRPHNQAVNAVLAAMYAADAILAVEAGQRSAEPDHEAVVSMAREALVSRRPDLSARFQGVAGPMLRWKAFFEYRHTEPTPAEATELLRGASQAVAIARRVVEDHFPAKPQS